MNNRPKKYKKALWLQIREDSNPVKWADSSSKALAIRPKSIRRRTPKREKEEREYRKRVKELMAKKPHCENPLCSELATEVHHRSGRRGLLLNYEPEWVLLCKKCHEYVHRYPIWARQNLLLCPMGCFNDQTIVPKNYYNQ